MQSDTPILVPLDGSATAEAVLPWAERFALALEQRLVLLRLVSPHDLEGENDPTPALRTAQHYLDGVALSLKRPGLTLEVRASPVDSHVSEGITGMAAALHAELIALAGHGRSGPERWALGSVADEVVRTASRPVLVVRSRPSAKEQLPVIGRILVPLDGSALAEQSLPAAARLAQAFDAALVLVRLAPWRVSLLSGPADEDERDAGMYLRGITSRLPDGIVSEYHTGQYLQHSNPADAIVNLARWMKIDLIVVATHGRSGLRRWMLGSVADAVVRSSDCPVYLLHASQPVESPSSASHTGA